MFYLLTAGTAFAEFARESVMVSGDAAATARNVLASEPLYRLGFAADVAGVASYLVVTGLLYGLLKPVNANLSLLAAFFGVVGVATQAASTIGHFAPLVVLSGAPYLAPLGVAQLQAIALLSLQLHAAAFNVALVFFGVYCVLIGCLIYASAFLPRVVGLLTAIAGIALLTNSFASMAAPAAAHVVSMIALPLDGAGELSLMLWLLVMGVDVPVWNARASRAAD